MVKVKRNVELVENLADYQYASHQSITLPASSILIGDGNTLNNAVLYTNTSSTTFSFANGTGNNGLDTGAEANNQWYALYAVPITGTSNFMLKASVNPPPQAGGAGPVGFTKYRYLGLFRNGTNGYDATNNSYGQGDIVKFTKFKRQIDWQSFNSTNGGLFPAVNGIPGIIVFVANTAVDSVVVDYAVSTTYGFTGTNPSGGARLPYANIMYRFCHQCNTAQSTQTELTDNVNNIRAVFTSPMSLGNITPRGIFWHQYMPGEATWASSLISRVSGNPNISRVFAVEAMVDPYIIDLK